MILILKDPILHFMIAAIAITTIETTYNSHRTENNVITITRKEQNALIQDFQKLTRSRPTPAEREAIISQYILDEV